MYQKLDATADNLALLTNLRKQDAAFSEKLLSAIAHGKERCPMCVNNKPGTKKPILGYRLD